ncbi:hypothetical protein EJB05_46307 [Eragrostis curvula]|uniref:Uncharacterized protein n=1 Tax=Eragrostis curvula TaxID=38414 RepID=A0A5J9TMN0_9POAL|nr:hypothetical protein EJB05_46307 [Eragrostis curvula]
MSSLSHASVSRIYGPRDLEDGFHLFKGEAEMQPLLATIQKIYRRQKVDKEYVSGFCFGLLDPATNILVNSSLHICPAVAEDVIQLSLEGLVAFLTSLFPYLPEGEAMGYLCAANAHPIAAASFIMSSRGLCQFNMQSEATCAAVVTALRCAAAAAKISPELMVDGWLGVDLPRLQYLGEMSLPETGIIAQVIAERSHDESRTNQSRQLGAAWELSKDRVIFPKEGLPPAPGVTKRLLLSRIHRHYLQALSILPTDELRKHYHRSMLMGGYCYGPLHDPVSNIIINTIWYEHNFPKSKQPAVDMVSTKSLWRVAARSLYGLVSFLCTRYPSLTPELALQRLLAARAALHVADPYYFVNISERSRWMDNFQVAPNMSESEAHRMQINTAPVCSVAEAYIAAATAAFHPNPLAQHEFLGSPDAFRRLTIATKALQVEVALATQLWAPGVFSGRILSCRDLELVSMSLKNSYSNEPQELAPLKLKKWIFPNVIRYKNQFWEQHKRVSRMVKSALAKFSEKTGQPFKLHIICGVNELVGSPVEVYEPQMHAGYQFTHVNFLAVPKGQPSAAVLFFAEYANYVTDGENKEKDDDSSQLCVPLNLHDPEAEHIRCIYCEREGSKILHPIRESFYMRDTGFEKQLLGEAPFSGSTKECYANDILFRYQPEAVDWVYDLPDDSIYTEYCVDDEDDGDDYDWAGSINVC